MVNNSTDVVIVGGGVIGCATALYLARRGVSATVVEMNGVGDRRERQSGRDTDSLLRKL